MKSLSPGLLEELRRLHPRQLEAVLHDGNVVVRAGPGSGKTRTLVARVAYVLEAQISPFRGVACITYTNAAADEISRRVADLGAGPEGRLACSTLHSFCINEILRAHASITRFRLPVAGSVIDEDSAVELLQRCFDDKGIVETTAQWRQGHITKIRRDIATDALLDGYDPREIEAARAFDAILRQRGLLDFESMVAQSLRVVQEFPAVRDLLRARFPQIAVDEYQDLGGVLHRLVLTLRDDAGIRIFAVGDGDQSVFGFTGSDPRFMGALEVRDDFRTIELSVNYRSGQDVIRASEAALGKSLGRLAVEGAAPGTVEVVRVQGALDAHAVACASIVEGLLADEIPAEKIAVLYSAKGPIVDELLAEMGDRGIPLFHERDVALPKGGLSKFVQGCASRTLLLGQARRARVEGIPSGGLLGRTEAPPIFALERALLRLRRESELPPPKSRLHVLRTLQRVLDPQEDLLPEASAGPWLDLVAEELELDAIGEGHPDVENVRALESLRDAVRQRGLAIQDLAARVEVIGKVLLTTYHSAKGREFRAVVLPALVNGLVPRDVADRGRWRSANASELAEQRRAFYVAVSRAEEAVFLLVGPGYHTSNGYYIAKGPSDFVVEMLHRLS